MHFPSFQEALDEGKKKHGFIAKLTIRFGQEFDNSVYNVRKMLHNDKF